MSGSKMNLFVLQMINFAANSGYSIVIPLYPPLAKDKGISDSVIGYIFCLYPVGGFIVTIVLGSVMTVQSMKKVLIISMKIMLVGLILTIIGMAGIGTVNYIEDTIPFAIVSAAMRLISGIGATCCFTPSYGMAAYLFKSDLTKVSSQLQIVAGFALFSGPFIGSVFFIIGEHTPIGGFSMPMYVLSLIYLLTIPLLIYKLKLPSLDKISILIQEGNTDQVPIVSRSNTQQMSQTMSGVFRLTAPDKEQQIKSRKSLLSAVVEQLNYNRVFRIPAVVLTVTSQILLYTTALGARTYFAVHLQESYGLSESQSTLVFLFNTVIGSVAAYLVGKIKNLNAANTICIGLFISSLSYFFYGTYNSIIQLGPDTAITGLPHSIWAVCVADALFGLGNGIYNVCMVSGFMANIKEYYPNCTDDVGGMASALYILGWTIGEFAGPLIGGTMMEYLPFERVSSIFGIVMFTMFAIYFSYCVYLHRKANKVNSSDALITDKEQVTGEI